MGRVGVLGRLAITADETCRTSQDKAELPLPTLPVTQAQVFILSWLSFPGGDSFLVH